MGGLGLFNGCGCTSCSNSGNRSRLRPATVPVSNSGLGFSGDSASRYSFNSGGYANRSEAFRRYRNRSPYGLTSGLGDALQSSNDINITGQSITDWAKCFFNPFDWTCNPDPLRQGQSYPSPLSYVDDPVTTIEQVAPNSSASSIVGAVQTVTNPTNILIGAGLIGAAVLVLAMSK